MLRGRSLGSGAAPVVERRRRSLASLSRESLVSVAQVRTGMLRACTGMQGGGTRARRHATVLAAQRMPTRAAGAKPAEAWVKR